jgi:D-lactate dehydrogenase
MRTPLAEHTFALMLALSRRIIEAREVKRKTRFSFEWWRGFELENKTLGVIGTGQIGKRVIHLALAFGMKVLAYDPYQQTELAARVAYHLAAYATDSGDVPSSRSRRIRQMPARSPHH